MFIKVLVIILFIGVVTSLTSGLVFLLKDVGSPRKRTLYALGTRVTLASLLLITVFYGLYTGKLGSHAPWDKKLSKEELQEQMHRQQNQ